MTCIVGLVHKEKVIIGGDSAGSNGYDVVIRKDPKVFRNGPFVIGCTSSFRMIQILRFGLKPPKIKGDLYRYMCTAFVDAVRKAFEAGGYLQKATAGDEQGGCFIVGVNGRLFVIESDFQVGEPMGGFASVGCGDRFALGSMFATPDLPPKKRVKTALKAAAKFSTGVEGPFLIKNSK